MVQQNVARSVGSPAPCSEASTDHAFAQDLSHLYHVVAAIAMRAPLWTTAITPMKSFRLTQADAQVARQETVQVVVRPVPAPVVLESCTDRWLTR